MKDLMLLTRDGEELGRVPGWDEGRVHAQSLANERGEIVILASEGQEETFEPADQEEADYLAEENEKVISEETRQAFADWDARNARSKQ